MCKDSNYFTELGNYLEKNCQSRAFSCIMDVMRSVKLTEEVLGASKHHNCKMTNLMVFVLRLCFPFFSVKDPYHYSSSPLMRMYECGKDMFYRFQNNGNIRWRDVLYSVNRQLLKMIQSSSNTSDVDGIVCLAADDSDLPKTGMHIENIGKIYSHVEHRCKLGEKYLSLMRTDGKTQTMLDLSVCAEEGGKRKRAGAEGEAAKEQRKQGLTEEQRKRRMHKDHKDEYAQTFVDELFSNKIDKVIEMVRNAIRHRVKFDYLLVDSWFMSAKLVKFIKSRHIKCNLIGMTKMGNTKYATGSGDLTAKEIVRRNRKQARTCKKLHCKYFSVRAKFAGHDVLLFFCRRGHKGEWNALLTTDLTLDFVKAYKLYSRRWAIETSYKEMKQLLRLGKCESRNFTAQVASMAFAMIQYNILCAVKRFESYESVGSLFKEALGGAVELSIAEKIWGYILQVILVISEAMSSDATDLLQLVMDDDPRLKIFSKLYLNKNAS